MKDYMPIVMGNHALKNRLCEDALQGRLSHAYILEGASGSGKHTIALQCAAALVCEHKEEETAPLPCMHCLACRKILQRLTPDLMIVGKEGKATLGVDPIRFLREDVHIRPAEMDYKIYIIEDAQDMTPQAQNALLLTLEEPPAYAVFFLLCTDASSLLETVRSRAPTLRTEPLSAEQIDLYLQKTDERAVQLKRNRPDEYAQLLFAADGGIGQALGLLDPKALSALLSQNRLISDFVKSAIRKESAEQMLTLLSRFSQKRDSLYEELLPVTDAVRDLIALKKSESAPLCFWADRPEAIALSDEIGTKELMRLYTALRAATDALERNANVRLTMLSLLSDADIL